MALELIADCQPHAIEAVPRPRLANCLMWLTVALLTHHAQLIPRLVDLGAAELEDREIPVRRV